MRTAWRLLVSPGAPTDPSPTGDPTIDPSALYSLFHDVLLLEWLVIGYGRMIASAEKRRRTHHASFAPHDNGWLDG
jgi:hypothetical protein